MKQITLAAIFLFISMISMNAQETAKIKITVGSASFVVSTYDNATAKAFIALLPMTISMNELNGNEKYHYLSGNLPSSPIYPSTIHTGDLMLYGQSCIVLFYETFTSSYSYTPIGYIDNPAGLKTVLGSNNSTVKFEVLENPTGIESVKQENVEFYISNDGLLQYIGDAERIYLIDMNGKTQISSSSKVLNISNLQKGIYILKIEEINQTKTFKIKI
jgi:hypothetical protein